MRTVIAGSRSICNDPDDILDQIIFDAAMRKAKAGGIVPTVVISGRARGIDQAGERWAERNNIPTEAHPAEWDKYGRGAGYKRNAEMVKIADAVIVIWDGVSKGSAHTVRLAEKARLPLLHHTKTYHDLRGYEIYDTDAVLMGRFGHMYGEPSKYGGGDVVEYMTEGVTGVIMVPANTIDELFQTSVGGFRWAGDDDE